MSGHGAPLLPPATLGVIGGGQLGRMFVQAAQRMGYRTIVLASTADSPAAQVAHASVVGSPDDLSALREIANRADALTVEFENVSAAGLRWLARRRPVRPGWRSVWVAQNRLREKAFLSAHGVPLAPWGRVGRDGDLSATVAAIGLPLVLKTAASGYDGKGQSRVNFATDAERAWVELGRVACVAERVVEFIAECSVIVVRGLDGATAAFPTFLNRHARHILDTTIAPAPLGPIVTLEARELALKIAADLDHVGVLAVEFFVTAEGRLLVNELAPRPHNSGHLTIEACASSQFEQQVRALCGLPLGSTDLVRPAAMANLLGDLWVDGEPDWRKPLAADPGVKLHLYGKPAGRPGRKMGHITALDDDPEYARRRVMTARGALAAGVEP